MLQFSTPTAFRQWSLLILPPPSSSSHEAGKKIKKHCSAPVSRIPGPTAGVTTVSSRKNISPPFLRLTSSTRISSSALVKIHTLAHSLYVVLLLFTALLFSLGAYSFCSDFGILALKYVPLKLRFTAHYHKFSPELHFICKGPLGNQSKLAKFKPKNVFSSGASVQLC